MCDSLKTATSLDVDSLKTARSLDVDSLRETADSPEFQSNFDQKQNEMIKFFKTLVKDDYNHIIGNFFVKTFIPYKEPEKLFHHINWEITKEKDIEEKLIKFCHHLEEKLSFMIPSNTTFISQIKIFKQLFKPKDMPIGIAEGKKDAWIGVYEVPSKNQIIFLFWFSEYQYDFVWPILKDIFTLIFLS